MRYAIVILAVTLAGCAKTINWTKADAEPNEIHRDKADCMTQAGQAAPRSSRAQWNVYRLCMRGRGWQEIQ